MISKTLRTTTFLSIIIFLAACSDYPTSGSLVTNMNNDDVIVNNYDGIIIELKPQIRQQLNDFYKFRRQNVDAFNENTTLLNTDHKILNKKAVKTLNEQYQKDMTAFKEKANEVFKAWQANLSKDLEQAKKEKIELDKTLNEFKTYTAEYETQIEEINKIINHNKEETQKILEAIKNKTNELIINSKQPIKQIQPGYFRLRSRVKTWESNFPHNCRKIKKWGGYKEYKIEDYIVIDQLKSQRKCTYINRPKKEIVSDGYDQFIVDQYLKSEEFDNDELNDKLKELKKQLRDATIVARNQTGEKYSSLTRSQKEKESKIDYLTKLIEEVTLEDLIAPDDYFSFNNRLDFNHYEATQRLSSIKSKLREFEPNGFDVNKEYAKNIYAIYEDAGKEIVKSNIKETSKIKNDGSFSGLDGSYGFVVAIVQFDLTESTDRYTSTDKMGVVQLYNIEDQNHPIAKAKDFNIKITNDNMERSREDVELTDELIFNVLQEEFRWFLSDNNWQ